MKRNVELTTGVAKGSSVKDLQLRHLNFPG